MDNEIKEIESWIGNLPQCEGPSCWYCRRGIIDLTNDDYSRLLCREKFTNEGQFEDADGFCLQVFRLN